MKTLEEKTYQQRWDEMSNKQIVTLVIREVVNENLITSLIWERLSDIILICQMIQNDTLMIPATDDKIQSINLDGFEHGNYILQITDNQDSISSQIIPQIPSQFIDYEIEVPERVQRTLRYCAITANGVDFMSSIYSLSEKATKLYNAFDVYEGLKGEGVDILK